MAPLPPWADLHPDLLIHIADRLHGLKCYASARGACTSWRRALPAPCPALLAAAEDATLSLRRPSAASLPSPSRSFELARIVSGSRCVGSSNGWLALCVGVGRHDYDLCRSTAFFLVNPVTGAEIALPPLLYRGGRWISKVVFAPTPADDDFAAAAICDANRIVYVTSGATSWAVLAPVLRTRGDQLTDLVYHDEGEGRKVYCLTTCGDVLVLHLPERCRRDPAVVIQGPKLSVVRPPKGIDVLAHRLELLDTVTGPVTIGPYDRIRRHGQDSAVAPVMIDPYWTRSSSSEARGPDLNPPPARIEPLLSADSNSSSFSPATAFASPYHAVSALTNSKHLVFCEGNMFQVWRNTSCTVNVNLSVPGVGQYHRVLSGEVFVLRYYPRRRPCWDVVKDLGGYSFFVGRNNAVSMYAEGVPGLRGNCVYWIGGRGREKAMVFDMQTGRSTQCGHPSPAVVTATGCPRITCLWFFLSDI
ncbi:unnamed protein product [Urochloa humidicola]